MFMAACEKEEVADPVPKPDDASVAEETPAQPVEIRTEPETGEEVAVFETELGMIVFMFHPEVAPLHVARFKELISSGFYDGTRFHRCIPGMMIQGGDPQSKDLAKSLAWGTGGFTSEDGTEINIPAEFNSIRHVRGVVSTARGGDPNSASSQFFLMHADYPSLDGQYTAFGTILFGMSVVDAIVMTGNSAGNVAPESAAVLNRAYLTTWPFDDID